MKINFILPAMGKTGGVLVVIKHAAQLHRMGHDVRIYYPVIPYKVYFQGPFGSVFIPYLKQLLRNICGLHGMALQLPEHFDLRRTPFITNSFIRDADAIIATAWPTAYDVANLSASKGEKFYFVQDYEIWHGKKDKVDASYQLPLKLLVIAPWLNNLMRTQFGRQVAAEIHNGIDLVFFHPAEKKMQRSISILMMYHILPSKGIADGLDVLRRVHDLQPEIRIRMFGMYPFPQKDEFIEYILDPTPDELLELYQSSDLFLCPSHSEGWGLTVVEALACGCAVVATNVGCVPVLKSDGNLLSVPPGDREALFQSLEFLVNNPHQMEEMKLRARESVLNYGWKERSEQLEQVLVSSTR